MLTPRFVCLLAASSAGGAAAAAEQGRGVTEGWERWNPGPDAAEAECWTYPKALQYDPSGGSKDTRVDPLKTPEFCCGDADTEAWRHNARKFAEIIGLAKPPSQAECWSGPFTAERCCRSPAARALGRAYPVGVQLSDKVYEMWDHGEAGRPADTQTLAALQALQEATSVERSGAAFVNQQLDSPICISPACGHMTQRLATIRNTIGGHLWMTSPHVTHQGSPGANATPPVLRRAWKRLGRFSTEFWFTMKRQSYSFHRSHFLRASQRLLQRISGAPDAWPRRALQPDGRWAECAEGPFAGHAPVCRPHHPVFLAFLPGPPPARTNGLQVRDWLGSLQPMDEVCEQHERLPNTATRYLECFGHTPKELSGEVPTRATPAKHWPLLDEEYFEHIQVLSAALEARSRGRLTYVEWGCGPWAIWAAKLAAAWRRVGLGQPCTLVLIDVFERYGEGVRKLEKRGAFEGCEVRFFLTQVEMPADEAVEAYLGGLGIIDLLDMDCQGCEGKVIPVGRKLLKERVRRLHVGTHSRTLHRDVSNIVRDDGWDVPWDYQFVALEDTAFGLIPFVDGVISMVNPSLGL